MPGSYDRGRPTVTLIAAVLAALFLLAAPAFATTFTYTTADRTFAERLAVTATDYAVTHDGRAPESWADFEALLGLPLDLEFERLKPTKRYAIISPPLPLPAPRAGAELLLITRRPFRDLKMEHGFFGVSRSLRSPGRWIVYLAPSGRYQASHVNEAYVQEAFRTAGRPLPEQDSEPLRKHEVEASRRTIIGWTITAALSFLVTILGVARFRRRKPAA